ncbi:hypothetical protein PybrP1_000236 [[Pythium] brassicae (nom. inval.)]|nr:hypothetical protein PybrP1_000236 [[Pythium] brassicae (nom. inval.)]
MEFAAGTPYFQFRWIHELGYFIEKDAANGAASSGSLNVLSVLHCLGPENAMIDAVAVELAVKNGHLHYLREYRIACRGDDIDKAAANEHTGIVKLMREDLTAASAALQVLTDCSLFPNIVASASGTSFFVIQVYRQLECAGHKRMDVTIVGKDVCKHGYHINYEVASGAASSGNLDVLLFLQSVGPENATINESALSAIEAGQLRVVQYMHENGYECWDSDIDKAAKNGHVDVVRYMLENDIGIALDCALDQAAKRGHLEVVELLCESGCVISDYGVLGDVIKNHRFDIIQVLCQSGIDGAIRCAMAEAVKLGKIEYVKFLYELDPVNCANEGGYHTADAAKRGYLDIIKFFHECGDPRLFDSRAMHFAAVHGHLDIVKFLHENREEGCKHFTPEYTHESGHHHIVDYLCENRRKLYGFRND